MEKAIGLVQLVLILPVLISASIEDIRTRECSDFSWIIIGIVGALSFHNGFLSPVLGSVSVFLPLFIAVLIKPGSIGGADIKACAVLGLITGFPGSIWALAASLVPGILITLIYRKAKKKDMKEGFALVPYISFGFVVIKLLEIFI